MFCCGFECGRVAATAPHWGAISGTGGSITTTSPLSGLRSLNLASTGGAVNVQTIPTFGAGIFVLRTKVRFTALPTLSTTIVGIPRAGAFDAGVFLNVADSKIYARADFTAGANGVAVTTGVVYTIDIKVNTTANPWVADATVNGVACSQSSGSQTADTTAGTIILYSGQNGDVVFDDVALSITAADYPIGPGYVQGFVPNADGTHTCTTTTIVKGTAAVPVGANVAGNTDAFNWVNARPIGGGATDATRLINQQTAGATLYAELRFQQALIPPRAVEVLVVDQQATTAVGDMHIKLNDNGTENVILDRTAVAGVITDRYTTKHYATMVGGGAWTLARFNNLRMRFGYSSDATPDQYCRGMMIEAEFPYVSLAPPVKRPQMFTRSRMV